jgi:predicted ATPase
MLVMIRRFALQNFKGHQTTELELGRFTLLVGENASGKTSVLDALALQAAIVRHPATFLNEDDQLHDLVRRGADGPVALSAQGQWRSGQPRTTGPVRRTEDWNTTLTLEPGSGVAGDANNYRRLEVVGRVGETEIRAAATSLGETSSDAWGRAAAVIGTTGLYRLRAEAIAAAAYSERTEVRIEADGTNTAVALAAMKLADDEAFERVESGLRKVVPSVDRVRIRRAKVQHESTPTDVVGSKLYFDFRGAPDVPADGASHGTLIVLALLTILHGANRPCLILLDDFDHALHPRAQIELVRMLKGLLALDEFADVQIVATTHSPYVLDELEPSDVYAFALRPDGIVAARRLSEHPDAETTRGTLKAGQLWSLDPERSWVVKA